MNYRISMNYQIWLAGDWLRCTITDMALTVIKKVNSSKDECLAGKLDSLSRDYSRRPEE